MVKPMHGYETKDGKYLLFVDSQSCARRRSLTGTGGVETIIGRLNLFMNAEPETLVDKNLYLA